MELEKEEERRKEEAKRRTRGKIKHREKQIGMQNKALQREEICRYEILCPIPMRKQMTKFEWTNSSNDIRCKFHFSYSSKDNKHWYKHLFALESDSNNSNSEPKICDWENETMSIIVNALCIRKVLNVIRMNRRFYFSKLFFSSSLSHRQFYGCFFLLP